jgi:hypothetical protein
MSKKGYPNCEYVTCHVQSLENDFTLAPLAPLTMFSPQHLMNLTQLILTY